MKRVNYHITEQQHEALKEISDDTGLSVAELIRRAIDEAVKEYHRQRNRDKKAKGE